MEKIRNSMDGKNVDTVLMELGVRFHRLIYEHLQQYSYSCMGGMLAICDVAEYRKCAKDFKVSMYGLVMYSRVEISSRTLFLVRHFFFIKIVCFCWNISISCTDTIYSVTIPAVLHNVIREFPVTILLLAGCVCLLRK